jgi:superfamily II DNA or RNA helicase
LIAYNILIKENEELKKEVERLRTENNYLKSLLMPKDPQIEESITEANTYLVKEDILQEGHIVTKESGINEKLALYKSLFKGREDVYALRWVNKDGTKSGYSPACLNEWKQGLCNKGKVKCSECSNRSYAELDGDIIKKHWKGEKVVGIYPMLKDETCFFLAVDFDGEHWRDDVSAYVTSCDELGVPASIERSRSGDGAHVWVFFSEVVSAALARKMGSAIITYSMEKRYQMDFKSYDRLFPNQDTMPDGGFGNLIALPLQREAAERGNSVFIDRNFEGFKDQMKYLSTLQKMSKSEVQDVVSKAEKEGKILGIRYAAENDDNEEKPWESKDLKKKDDDIIRETLPKKIKCILSNLIYIYKNDLPSAMINKLIRIAAFQNPEFYKTQALRKSTHNIPRIIKCCDESNDNYLGLPRGCMDGLQRIMDINNVTMLIDDKRISGESISAEFQGNLTKDQAEVSEILKKHNHGVVSAATAFGKTVVGAWLISDKKVNTLIIVNRTSLLEQWKERLMTFLNVDKASIGEIGGGKNKRTGIIDIALIQSLNNRGEVKDYVSEYGQVIVDECHHIAAFGYEQVLRSVKAKYVYGLTATPIRRDGHQPITFMQCGPVIYRKTAKDAEGFSSMERRVVSVHTEFTYKEREASEKITIQELYQSIAEDEKRNDQIFDDVLSALQEGRSPLLLTERTAHVEYLRNKFKGFAKNIITLTGGMGKKKRQDVIEQLRNIGSNEERLIIATGKYIGEGFDDQRLDTLFLAMPVSWKGTLQQYAGRLHRNNGNKKKVVIYDYVDDKVPMLLKMYNKRVTGYKNMGYTFKST